MGKKNGVGAESSESPASPVYSKLRAAGRKRVQNCMRRAPSVFRTAHDDARKCSESCVALLARLQHYTQFFSSFRELRAVTGDALQNYAR